ncbi:conserved hypothetical protein, secreted [Candidatus Magnetomorum sp. HK-1]|nr:conserved hypothetical protein, secreted [Candidatus Magnetomorum sp. HK-1]
MRAVHQKKLRTYFIYISLLLLLLLILPLIYFFFNVYQNSNKPSHKFLSNPKNPDQQKNEINSNSLQSAKKSCTPIISWFPDARQMYDYQFKTEIVLNDNALLEKDSDSFSKETKIIVHVSGVLNFRVFEKPEDWPESSDASLVYVAFQLSSATVKYAEKDLPLQPQKDLKELFQTLFCVAFLKNGLCFQYFFPNDLNEADRSSLSELIYAVQLVLSEKKHISRWIVPEVHTLGRFLAEYRVMDASCQMFEKQNVRCISLIKETSDDTSSFPFSLTGRIVESQFKLSVSELNSWLTSCQGNEQIDLLTQKGKIWSTTKTSVQMNILPFNPDSELSIWSNTINLDTLLSSFFDPQKNLKDRAGIWEKKRIDSLKKRFKNSNLFQMIADLENVLINDGDQSQKARLSHLIHDYFTAYPEAVYQIPGWLKNGTITNKTVGHMMLALERVGHKDAQKVLKSIIMDQGQAENHRVQAIVAAASLENPITELTDDLLGIIEDSTSESGFDEISSTTLLALGILSHTYDKNGQALQAKTIIDQLKLTLENSNNTADKVTCFKALGNAKAAHAIEVIDDYIPKITSSDIEEPAKSSEDIIDSEKKTELSTEVAAILALGKMPESPATIERLIPLLAHERQIIRTATIDAVSQMESPEITTALCAHLISETDENIRRKIIRYLGDHKNETVIKTLEDHLDLSNQHPEKEPISREEAEDVYRALIQR